MLGLNPGKAERQVHDEYMTRWVYVTNDTAEEILSCENYLVYLNHSPAKIAAGDEIVILSKPVTGDFHKIILTVGYNPEEETFFPIFLTKIDVLTGQVSILTRLEEYLDFDDEGEGSAD